MLKWIQHSAFEQNSRGRGAPKKRFNKKGEKDWEGWKVKWRTSQGNESKEEVWI